MNLNRTLYCHRRLQKSTQVEVLSSCIESRVLGEFSKLIFSKASRAKILLHIFHLLLHKESFLTVDFYLFIVVRDITSVSLARGKKKCKKGKNFTGFLQST